MKHILTSRALYLENGFLARKNGKIQDVEVGLKCSLYTE